MPMARRQAGAQKIRINFKVIVPIKSSTVPQQMGWLSNSMTQTEDKTEERVKNILVLG